MRIGRRWQRASLLLAAAVAALVPAGPSTGAGEDPPSVYLVRQATFLSPGDGDVPPVLARRLVDLVRDARGQGYRLRVAVIATRFDLLRSSALFGHPVTYAKVLGEDDFYYWKDEVLVVMPAGFGVYRPGTVPLSDEAALRGVPLSPTADGAELVQAASRAVHVLAARRGLIVSSQAGTYSVPKPSSLTTQGSLRWDLEGLLFRRVGRNVVLMARSGAVALGRPPCRARTRCASFRFLFAVHTSTRLGLLPQGVSRTVRSGLAPVRVLDRYVVCGGGGARVLVEAGSGQTARLECATADP